MPTKLTLLFIFSLCLSTLIFGQQRQKAEKGNGSIMGKVYDEQTKEPIPYSNIILYTQKDSTQVTGTVSDLKGEFTLKGIKDGTYYVSIQYVGYKGRVVKNISISASKPHVELGNLAIIPTAINLKNVVVEGKRPSVSYQLDKQVIDVSQMNTTISGNAADVLQNVPSVNVDIDGNVSLRGSTDFTVYIDGRPSVMDAQDALQQIPASAIKSIEIITNPSAKYDAEGTAGIINIILKKNQNLGLSGIINLDGGFNDKYGGSGEFQYKTPKIGYDFGVDYNKRNFPGSSTQKQQFIVGDNTSYLNSNGNMSWGNTSFDLRGSVDFNLGEIDNLSFGGRYGSRDHLRNSTLNYVEWSDTDPDQFLYLSNSDQTRSGSFYALNTNWQHKFNDNDQNELTGELFLSHDNSNETTNSSDVQSTNPLDGKNAVELGPRTHFRGKMDYTLPFADSSKFSAGTEFSTEKSQDINKLYQLDTTNFQYFFEPQFSNTTDYDLSEFALYSIYADKFGALQVQAGLRTEYTYQNVKLEETSQQYSVNKWDLFPSVHSSYHLTDITQFMASYSRRIQRPEGWQLEPFYTWIDPNDVRQGNPSLLPEYIDSYELGFQTSLAGISISSDLYYHFTHNKLENITGVYAPNVTLNTFDNVGNDYSLGGEYMFTFNPVKILETNLMGELYDYRIKGALNGESFNGESFDWNIKDNNTLNITHSTELQFNLRYYSPSVSPQGRWEGYFTTDAAVKQNLMGKQLSLTLQVWDLLKTGRWEFTSQGDDFYSYSHFVREAPRVMLDLRYNFNNFNEKQQNGNPTEGSQNNGQYN
jgi:outer membrane receptor protein involved in Fe transport